MINKRALSISCILISLVVVFGIEYFKDYQVEKNKTTYDMFLPNSDEEDPFSHLDENFVADKNFESNLPLVIIDLAGDAPPITTVYDYETNRHVLIEGIEPYVEATLEVIEVKDGVSKLIDNPSSASKIKIKRRGNSSMLYEKPQYLIKLISDSGEKSNLSLLGMGEENEWVLNGSMNDKSMLRNYLGFNISAQILDYTPKNRYCEVFINENGVYSYQGVYLLGESIKQGENRINISEYQSTASYGSYIIKRDRYDENAISLNTYATKNGLSNGSLELLYPNNSKATQEVINYVETDISNFEKILYSDDPFVFATYKNYIDIDSFVDYFIINEFFGNYDAGENSTYLYKDIKGKLCIGPVWDFDGAIDNFELEQMDVERIAFYKATWFNRLLKDKDFLEKVEKRYNDLRSSILSEENIDGTVDYLVEYLSVAEKRNWQRWSYDLHNTTDLEDVIDESGDVAYRNSTTYEAEIYKIKTILRKHGNILQKELKGLEYSTVFNTDYINNGFTFLLLCIFIFIAPIVYIARYFK